MVNYNDSKIYKIVDNTTGKFYIGATSLKYLSQRLQKHLSNYKDNYKNVSSYEIFKNENFKIELIEMCPCNNIYELRKREGEIILQNKDNILCVNKVIEYGLIKKGNDNWYKEYYEINKDKIKEKQREYRKTDEFREKRRKTRNKERENELKRLKRLYLKIDKIFGLM